MKKVFEHHANEERNHPKRQTLGCIGLNDRLLLNHSPDDQVIALNVLGERIALDFFTAMVPVLTKSGILDQEAAAQEESTETQSAFRRAAR